MKEKRFTIYLMSGEKVKTVSHAKLLAVKKGNLNS